MAIDDEQGAVFLVLEGLALRGETHERRRRDGVHRSVRVASEKFRILTVQEIRTLRETRRSVGSLPADGAINLEPPNHERNHGLAFLWAKWDFSRDPASCGFFYGIWYHFRPPIPLSGGDPEMRPAFIGYRFETPGRDRNHAYFHCQPCRNLGDPGNVIPQALERSEHNPTFPLPAWNSLSLLLCLVLSLYGFDQFEEIMSQILEAKIAQRNEALTYAVRQVKELAA